MKIGTREVAHIASLAEMELTPEELASVAHDMERIVGMVEALGDAPPHDGPVSLGPPTLRLREDVVNPVPLARGPSENAPAWQDGFFIVPALDGLADE